jgi:hypothetical protein
MAKKIYFFIFLSLFLFPFSTHAFDLWDSRVITNRFNVVENNIEITTNSVVLLGSQMSATFTESLAQFEVRCCESPSCTDYGLSFRFNSFSPELFVYNNPCPYGLQIISNSPDNDFDINVFYADMPLTSELQQYTNENNGSTFFVDQSISYGQILILIFVILFYAFGVFRFIWNFFNKNSASKL